MKVIQVSVFIIVVSAASVFAARPLETDDAGTVEPGFVEVELGAAFESASGDEAWEPSLGLKTGLMPGLDFGLGLGWQRILEDEDTEDGVSDPELGLKWSFVGETENRPAMTLAAAVKLPAADEDRGLGSGETDWDVTLILSKALAETLTGHLNAGYSWIGGADGDAVHGSAALELQLTDSFCLVGEILAERELEDDVDTALIGNAGLRWTLSDSLALDAAVGTGLNGDDLPDFTATVGLTWLFGIR